MKILYIAHDRCAAEVALKALDRIAPHVRLSWASSPGLALDWMRGNRDFQAVIVDTGRDDPAFDSFLEQARSLGVTAPIAAIAPEPLEALAAALETDRMAEQDAALARTGRICTALQERALELEAALHRADERHASVEDRLVREAVLRALLEERVASAETARADADRNHKAELAALITRLAEREAQHESATARGNRICVGLQQRLMELETAAHEACERHAADAAAIARLQQEADGLRRQLDAMRTRTEALRRDAAQVSDLQAELGRSRKDSRRQFERAPYGLCECSGDGSITRVNHSLARLLGYRSGAALQGTDVVATVFESAADLRFLLDRALHTGQIESLQTTLKTRDLRRLSVRLHAHSRDGAVAVAVEDLTPLHELEQRLREAQRLEAVGRVASEVAATCDTLLRDASQDGRQWLSALDSNTRLRQQGELLLGDVSRAAGFLRQFVVYGHQQISTAASVDLARALRDLAPILKRVAGDDIALLLPKTTSRFDIDVDGERVERILVNVANYARARMPHGGRVKIQLATAVVDREFVASHPEVRPGEHVLITISEVRGPVWPALPIVLPISRPAHAARPRTSSDRPGMDLGSLGALISDAGGHLWMSAEPEGNMTLRIHLPKRSQDALAQPAAAASGSRVRHMTRWFR